MKVTLDFDHHECIVEREPNDPRFHNSGWTYAESTFLYHVERELKKQGYDVIKKRMWRDGHLVDDNQQYIRTRHYLDTPPNTQTEFAVWNGAFAIYDAGDEFNREGVVRLCLSH